MDQLPEVFLNDCRLAHDPPVDIDIAMTNLDLFAGQTHDALDIVLTLDVDAMRSTIRTVIGVFFLDILCFGSALFADNIHQRIPEDNHVPSLGRMEAVA